jgi:hypothetical protein
LIRGTRFIRNYLGALLGLYAEIASHDRAFEMPDRHRLLWDRRWRGDLAKYLRTGGLAQRGKNMVNEKLKLYSER